MRFGRLTVPSAIPENGPVVTGAKLKVELGITDRSKRLAACVLE
jgi:hypothetical protein